MSKIEVLGKLKFPDRTVTMLFLLSKIERDYGISKERLFGQYGEQYLHRIFANRYVCDAVQSDANWTKSVADVYLDTFFSYKLLINGGKIDPNQVLSGQAHFIEGNKFKKNKTPKGFVAHTVVMDDEQWQDFLSACEQIEKEYPEEKDGYTKDGKTNQVIRRGRLLSRICQERLGGQWNDYASLPLEEIRAQIDMLKEIESKKG